MQKPEGMTYKRNAIFAVYKGERHLATGTAEECAIEMGVTLEYICHMASPTGKRRLDSRKNPNEATSVDVIDWEDGD